MRFAHYALLSSLLLACAAPAVASSHARRSATATRNFSRRTAKPKFQSQRTIDDGRATQIQTALIKAGYLTGTPTGHWDAASEAAMGKLQGDNGWQTKLVPDSRAIIKLGLGPNAAAADTLPTAAHEASLATGTPTVVQ